MIIVKLRISHLLKKSHNKHKTNPIINIFHSDMNIEYSNVMLKGYHVFYIHDRSNANQIIVNQYAC